MNKHIFGISTYFLTFFLSVLLVALFGVKEEPVVKEKIIVTSATFTGVACPLNRTSETVEQREIRKFLETDRSFANKEYRAEDEIERKKFIVKDMKELLKTSSVPAEIRIAYEENIDAWDNQLKHLKYAKTRNYELAPDTESDLLYREINFTYEKLLKTAKKYGVDYR